MRSKTLIGIFTYLVAAATSLPLAAEEKLTNEDIVKLARAEMSAAVIVAKIASSETAFDTSVEALIALSENGVEQEVLEAMLAAEELAEVEAETPAQSPYPRSEHQVDPTDPSAPTATNRTPQPRAVAGSTFRESLRSGGEGPLMVVIPAGSFRMGCLSSGDCFDSEKPVREVRMPQPLAVSVYEVTFEDYDRFTDPNRVDDEGWGRGNRPVINVSWDDAKEYVQWLSEQTGADYRLLTESEWEYAARAGSATRYSWGDEIGRNRANCDGCGSRWDGERTAPVGSFAANAFGLHDMHWNVWEWVEDCWNEGYVGAPSEGAAWRSGDCAKRVLRGGSWNILPGYLRSAVRYSVTTGFRYYSNGFRVARTLTP